MVLSLGMILLALTGLALHGLVVGRAGPHGWRSVLGGVRGGPGKRGDARAVLLSLGVNVAIWSAIVFYAFVR